MSIQTIGLVELSSIARGMETADAMLKASQIELLEARPICPGKYMVLVCGDVSSVQNSVDVGKAVGGHTVVDEFLLPSVHPSVIAAISGVSPVSVVGALGIIECFSVASLIVAADTAAKAAGVELIEVRTAMGIGGKSFVTLTGDVSSVKAAVEAGVATLSKKGMLVEMAIIASPHPQLKSSLL